MEKQHKRYVIKFNIDLKEIDFYFKKNPNLQKITIENDKLEIVLSDAKYMTPVKMVSEDLFTFTKDMKIGCKEDVIVNELSKIFEHEIINRYTLKGEEEKNISPQKECKTIRYHGDRIETGALKFGADHAGVFFRGDHSLYNAFVINNLIDKLNSKDIELDPVELAVLKGIANTFQSCKNK